MCLEPKFIADDATGEARVVVCRKCWQCRDRRVSDWQGRCIAEGRTAVASHSVTLTYGRDKNDSPDHVQASVLTYSDFQLWLKRLRKHGHALRYFVVGEYGGTFGRAHWHALVYWLRQPPEIVLRKRVVQAHWPDGWSFYDDIGQASTRYVCKYIQKDENDELKQAHMQMSKVPPLGAEYFSGLALKYVKQGLSPRDKVYKFRDVLGAEGNPKKFYLGGRSWELFVEAFVFWWELLRPGRNWPYSQVVQDHLDKLEPDWREVARGKRVIRPEPRFEDGTLISDFIEQEAQAEYWAALKADFPEYFPALLGWMVSDRVYWSERYECACYADDQMFSMPLYWHSEKGEFRWQNVAPSEAFVRARRYSRERPLRALVR